MNMSFLWIPRSTCGRTATTKLPSSITRRSSPLCLKLLRVSKKINAEASPLFYRKNEFRFSAVDGMMVLVAFMEHIGSNAKLLSKVISLFSNLDLCEANSEIRSPSVHPFLTSTPLPASKTSTTILAALGSSRSGLVPFSGIRGTYLLAIRSSVSMSKSMALRHFVSYFHNLLPRLNPMRTCELTSSENFTVSVT